MALRTSTNWKKDSRPLSAFGALALLLLAAAPRAKIHAEEISPTPLALVHPDSLTGWSYGDAAPIGWTADGQRLRGCEQGTPLVSTWTFGDFTLDFTWSPIETGTLEVLLPSAPTGDLLAITLADDRVGQIIDGEKQLAAGRELAAKGQTHRCRIERAGESLRVTVDDERASEASIAGDRRFGLSLAVPHGVVAIEQLTIAEPRGDAIFSGQDLAGWTTHRKPDVWAVESGELVTTKKGGEYLRSEKEYGDFTLAFDYLVERGGNSGLGLRTPLEKWPSGEGMELQILDRPGRDAGSQMSIYKHLPPLARADVSEAWNHVVVKCEGPILTAWVNGQIAQHANLDDHPQLAKKPRRGWLGFQNHGSRTRIKNVYLVDVSPEG